FGGRLPGPFTACAGIGLPPYPDSLDPASTATIPDLGRSLIQLWAKYSIPCQTCQVREWTMWFKDEK
ncbi:MAG: hypothetical protein ACWGQW_18020, partial [bacterium]